VASEVVCANSDRAETSEALVELQRQLAGMQPVVVMFFCSSNHDGVKLQTSFKAQFPQAEVIGCTTGGEFTDRAYTAGGVSVLALPGAKVRRAAAAMAQYDRGPSVEAAVRAATSEIARKLQVDLRELPPEHWVGVVLNEGLKGNEEEVNAVLGLVAPFLSFLGGSAGDNFKIQETAVFYDGMRSVNGSVFLLMELAVPYAILKTCSFEPTSTQLRIDRVQGRVVYEIDGRPALEVYAEKVGVKPEELQEQRFHQMVFSANPLGVVIDGEPWVRSPIAITPDGGIVFGCKLLEGSVLSLLRSTGLVPDTKAALARGAEQLGGRPSAGLLFNCAHRCMEIKFKHLEDEFCEAISHFPVSGFHSYGESWLAHMNQTLIALLIK
jgi:hypothetical protein